MITSAKLETQTRSFQSELSTWPAAHLTYRPSPRGWSALQVLEHLVKTEENILVAAIAGVRNPHPIGIRDRFGFRFIMKIFQTDKKVKTPASAAQVLPGPELDLEGLDQRWRNTRSDFKAFQAHLSPEQATLGIFRHPVIGWMSVQNILDFFWVHIVHHNFQIERIKRSVASTNQ